MKDMISLLRLPLKSAVANSSRFTLHSSLPKDSSLFTLHSSLKRRGVRATAFLILSFLIFTACTPTPSDVHKTDSLPPIYPDYTNITIPQNIAPLNFLLHHDSCDALEVKAGSMTLNTRGNEAVFDISEWKELLGRGGDIEVQVTARINGKWMEYRPFTWHVVKDSLDPWLTYRLIEPDYEVWNRVEIRQRCIENFDEAALADYEHQENRCMNCHTFGSNNPALSMMYVRGKQGGAILNQNGSMRKLDLKADSMISGSVYFGFSPSGRFITFSTNLIIPGFHSQPRKRLEVYDSASDVYVADLQEHRMLHSPLLEQKTVLETFPTFSPDGKYIYYCAADSVPLPADISRLQYALVRIPFDEATGTFGTEVDTIVANSNFYTLHSKPENTAVANSKLYTLNSKLKNSVCHPRISPDGRFLLYTVAYYGTFPIWHPEADLQMLDLQTGKTDTLAVVNSAKSDTYHSWSSNSRWFVFASKRDDGLYGKPYFCYVDREGRAHKPFCLPQQHPSFYDNTLKSFNAPELGRGPLPFTPDDVARAMKLEAEKFR